jgi:hypothetical protein
MSRLPHPAFLIVVAALTGCYYDNEEELYPGECLVGDATAPEYWTSTIQPVIQTRCAIPACHVPGGDGPGDFTEYANVKAAVDEGIFQQQVFIQRTMPSNGPLPACELQKLQAWVDAGAPE